MYVYVGLDRVISNTLLEQFHIQARRPVMLSSSVLVENIPRERCNRDWLDMYFTNRSKSGIECYRKIDILGSQKVVIHLENQYGKKWFCLYVCYYDTLRYGDNSQTKSFFTGR